MSRDRTQYRLCCKNCGQEDRLTVWMDDWNRWGIERMDQFSGRVSIIGLCSDRLTCLQCGRVGPDVYHGT